MARWGGGPGNITGRGDARSVCGLKDLCEWIGRKDVRVVVEVGVYAGDATMIFAQYWQDAMIYAVDPWLRGYDPHAVASRNDQRPVEELFDQHVRHFPNITKVKKKSVDAAKTFVGRGVDVVYIDGCHQYEAVVEDIAAWRKKTRLVVCGHDYNGPGWPGVGKAVRSAFGEPHKVFEDTSWAVRL